jgi:hypothetical protein
MAVPNLLFIDANIWLDFYRHRNNTGLRLLKHTEAIKDKLIVTYQLETEFKANRQAAILEGLQALKDPEGVSRPGIFSEAKAIAKLSRNLNEDKQRIKDLRARMVRALKNPKIYDPVYKVCQRIFHKEDEITLSRTDKLRHAIRRHAFKRFLHGCPPRKSRDISIGDAFNWEWMVYCAEKRTAGLIIVTRDGDYGVTYGGHSYINDHLRQEFSERVSQKRDLLLYASLSDALKLFSVEVSKQEQAAEKEVVNNIFAQRAAGRSTPARVLYNAILGPAASDALFYGEDDLRNVEDDPNDGTT